MSVGSGGPARPWSVLVTRQEMAARAVELGEEIGTALSGTLRPPVFVGILKGSTVFHADLVRRVDIDLSVDFMSISSYADAASGDGVVRIIKDLDQDIRGRDVVIVEDIVDTGFTLNYLRRHILAREPASLRTVALLDKSARRILPVPLEHRGFVIPDLFVVGYGLDYQARYRNLKDIIAVNDLAALARDPKMLVRSLYGAP
ncbi:MAG: hypoxanthine phosphoribosyltransferase [Actinomycetota bacterium]|jgi:hypoxanthine phosphoribosyltransferase|nr:hypoxanthine phosphoribosyltransferase [Actinomycetota bacterium]